MADDTPRHDTFPYPQGSVVGAFLDDASFTAVSERLTQAGFAPGSYQVLHGENDLNKLDTTGDKHGQMGRLFRKLQNAVTDEGEHARRYAEYLREGHYLVGVPVGEDEAAKDRAADAMRGGADFLVYYASNYIEDLGPGG